MCASRTPTRASIRFPQGADEEALVMLSDILPTGFECGVLNGQVQPGDTVAIVGAGPIGLAALLTAQFYSPAEIIMIDLDDNRLEVAQALRRDGDRSTARDGKAAETVMKLTGGRGVDVAIEAVGVPATFEICQDIVAPGGTIANVGVHGVKVDLHLEKLWVAQHHDHHAAGRHRHHADAAQDRAVGQDRPEAPDYPPLQARQDHRCLRYLRACRKDAALKVIIED